MPSSADEVVAPGGAKAPARSARVRQIVVSAVFALCVLGSFIGSGAFGGTPIAEAADGLLSSEATLLAPGPGAFSIWSLIYAGLGAYTVWQWFDASDSRRIAWLVAASLVLNAAWIAVVQAGAVPLSVVVIVVLLAVLAEAFRRLVTTRPRGRVEAVVADGTLGLYLGWVCVAVCANVAAALRGAGVDGGSAATGWAVAVLTLVAVLGVALAVYGRGRLAVASSIVWGLGWIAAARFDGPPASDATAVAAAAAAVVITFVTAVARLRSGPMPVRG
ncbi:tryptophan-rich sensory protein [Cellulomonas cellasea]|uniref:tryptophan-rich sensory protein n=1 Tax=Cellulomonas cellasea TaxID=43670 RepID=UPI0025A313F3|nr:tryptophan-rich sensory protein [Cellulomonas cellasea]MDM8086147.1 tryptophan-rich sensory protein [Cellulomonas cellasea]